MNYTVLSYDDLSQEVGTREFQGYLFDDTKVSFILVDMLPGDGPRLHSHPYEEVFIVQEGRVTFTIDSTLVEAQAGQIIIVPANMPHKFVNTGKTVLRQVDIHVSTRFITDWLEEPV